MTQLKRTEEVLDRGYHWEAIAEARDLAKRLDAVMAEIESPEDWDYEAGSRLERAQRALYPEYFQ